MPCRIVDLITCDQNNGPNKNIYLYINGRTDVCLFVYLSVGMWRANGNPNPCTDLKVILPTHPHLSKEGFGAGLTTAPSPVWAWGI